MLLVFPWDFCRGCITPYSANTDGSRPDACFSAGMPVICMRHKGSGTGKPVAPCIRRMQLSNCCTMFMPNARSHWVVCIVRSIFDVGRSRPLSRILRIRSDLLPKIIIEIVCAELRVRARRPDYSVDCIPCNEPLSTCNQWTTTLEGEDTQNSE